MIISFVHATEHLKVGIQVKCDNSLLRNAHDQSQITNVAWLDNSSLVSTGQVFFINFVSERDPKLLFLFRMPISRSGT